MHPHRASGSRQPLAQLAIAFSAGICAANYFHIGPLLLWIVGGVCTAFVLVAVASRRLTVAGVMLLVAVGVAGTLLAIQERVSDERNELVQFLGRPVILTGVIDGPPAVAKDRIHLTLSVERVDADGLVHSASGTVSLVVLFKSDDLHYGARVRVTTTLNRRDEYRNPGVPPMSEYLDRKGYDATGLLKSSASVTRLENVSGLSVYLLGALYSWRERLQREIDMRFAPETAAVLDAALLGNRYNLSRETTERFREGGTFHVLVISGQHISFIAGLVFLLMRRLTKRRALQFAISVAVVWAYSLAVGAEASVVRAALMFTFAGVGLLLFRESTSLNGLGCAVLFLLVRSPKELFDPSFQLTLLSVLAIVAIGWPLLQTCAAIGAWYPSRDTPAPPVCSRELRWFCEMLFWSERKWQRELARSPYRYRLFKTPLAARLERYRIQTVLRYIFAALVVSGAVQLVLLPLMIVYFHRVSLASLVLNIIVNVLLAALTAIALLALILAQISAALAAPLLTVADAINWLMIHSVDPFSRSNLSSIRLPGYSGWGALVYVLYFIPLLLAIKRPNRWVVIVQALLIAVVVFHPFSAGIADGKLRVDFLDVGQGDSALVTMPDGRTLLVDGGGNMDMNGSNTDKRSIGEAVVSQYLWWRGLDAVDFVLATHADADHIDGLNDVLRNFTVDAAIVARSPANDPEYAKFAQTLSRTRTHAATIQAGDVIHFGDVEMHVLWPPAAVHPDEPSRNNDSVVLRIRFGNTSLLLTGDIEKSAESALVGAGKELTAGVVKVPHHGSHSSSTEAFVAATRARFAIISVGQRSRFGHPHPEVVERWQASGARVLTTGKCGTITVTTDGTDLNVTGMQSRTLRESPCLPDP
jgi:competence protein ComEC